MFPVKLHEKYIYCLAGSYFAKFDLQTCSVTEVNSDTNHIYQEPELVFDKICATLVIDI